LFVLRHLHDFAILLAGHVARLQRRGFTHVILSAVNKTGRIAGAITRFIDQSGKCATAGVDSGAHPTSIGQKVEVIVEHSRRHVMEVLSPKAGNVGTSLQGLGARLP
jgi:hypothetical protein